MTFNNLGKGKLLRANRSVTFILGAPEWIAPLLQPTAHVSLRRGDATALNSPGSFRGQSNRCSEALAALLKNTVQVRAL